jgi:hypothetical protein
VPITALIPLGSGPARALRRSAKTCRRLLDDYADGDRETGSDFSRVLTEALDALKAAADAVAANERRNDQQLLEEAARCCVAAADICRGHGLDPKLLSAAASFERTTMLCTRAAAERAGAR